MSWLECILYGFVSGITEFLPVSSRAHQALMRYIFGINIRNSLQDLLVHIGVILAIFVGCREAFIRLHREQKAISGTRRRNIRSLDSKSFYDLRLLKTASIPLLVGLLLYVTTAKLENNLLMLLAFWLLNAVVLLLAEHTSHGNRDSRTMSALDGIVMGIAGAVSVLPGVSRTGMISAYTTARGVDSESTVNWAVLLGIPAMLFAICFDLFGMVSNGVGTVSFSTIICYLASGLMAFAGGYMGISLFKLLLNHSGFSKFAYYSIGAALFSFILYLIT